MSAISRRLKRLAVFAEDTPNLTTYAADIPDPGGFSPTRKRITPTHGAPIRVFYNAT
jgi:hypothetical protein